LGISTTDFQDALRKIDEDKQKIGATSIMWTEMIKNAKKAKEAQDMMDLGKPARCLMANAGEYSRNLVDRFTMTDINAMALAFYPMALHTFEQLYGSKNDAETLQHMQYHIYQAFRVVESKHLMGKDPKERTETRRALGHLQSILQCGWCFRYFIDASSYGHHDKKWHDWNAQDEKNPMHFMSVGHNRLIYFRPQGVDDFYGNL
jgi:hypothetical protein